MYFLHSTMPSVTCLRLSDVSVICRVTYFQFPNQSAFLSYIGRQAAPALRRIIILVYKTVFIRLHQHTSLNCAHQCLSQPIVVTSVLLHKVTLQYHVPEQRDMAENVLLFLDQRCGTHSR